jgi:hypothetical protein
VFSRLHTIQHTTAQGGGQGRRANRGEITPGAQKGRRSGTDHRWLSHLSVAILRGVTGVPHSHLRVSDTDLGDDHAGGRSSSSLGFCLPVANAMAFRLPMVVFAGGALPRPWLEPGCSWTLMIRWSGLRPSVAARSILHAHLSRAGRPRLRNLSEQEFTDSLAVGFRRIGGAP